MKTAELTGALLDCWVARAEGLKAEVKNPEDPTGRRCWTLDEFGRSGCLFRPSTSWAQGGPIIERERIQLEFHDWHKAEPWCGQKSRMVGKTGRGPAPLVAAMRAYVASKFGDEVSDA